jgi:hypothetical protein
MRISKFQERIKALTSLYIELGSSVMELFQRSDVALISWMCQNPHAQAAVAINWDNLKEFCKTASLAQIKNSTHVEDKDACKSRDN